MNLPELTKREREVLHLMAHGKHNNEIAQVLNISEHTVKFHVNSVIVKTQQSTRLGAVIYCLKLGLLNIKDLMPDLNLAIAKGEVTPLLSNITTGTAMQILEENKQAMKDQMCNMRENIVNDVMECIDKWTPSPPEIREEIAEVMKVYIPDA